MARDPEYNISETGNWNVASDFARMKIMRPLDNCDHYENIAQFGYDSLLDELINQGYKTEELQIAGFRRLVKELLKLINNSMFAMKKTGTKKTLKDFHIQLKKIDKIVPQLISFQYDQKRRTKNMVLTKEYYVILEKVLEIKSKINEPLNKNHLIFTDKEEYDPRKQKKKFLERATTRG